MARYTRYTPQLLRKHAILVDNAVKRALVLSPAPFVRCAVIPLVSSDTVKLVAFKGPLVAGVRGKRHIT